MKTVPLGAGVFAIEDFLSAQECVQFIAQSEALGYTEAAIRTDAGDRVYGDARNNDRIILDNSELALRLYQRASPLLPADNDDWLLHGFNARLRYYRYDQQQQFIWHQDGTVRLSATLESVLTFMIYLNDNFDGGSTDFGWESVKPVQGMALVFPHRLRHRGAVVRSGVKYVLRTDVMYQHSPVVPPSFVSLPTCQRSPTPKTLSHCTALRDHRSWHWCRPVAAPSGRRACRSSPFSIRSPMNSTPLTLPATGTSRPVVWAM